MSETDSKPEKCPTCESAIQSQRYCINKHHSKFYLAVSEECIECEDPWHDSVATGAVTPQATPTGEERTLLEDAYAIIERLRRGTTYEIVPTIKAVMWEGESRAVPLLSKKRGPEGAEIATKTGLYKQVNCPSCKHRFTVEI